MSEPGTRTTLVVGSVPDAVVDAAKGPAGEARRATPEELGRWLAAEGASTATRRIVIAGPALAIVAGRIDRLLGPSVGARELWTFDLDRAPATVRRALERLRFAGRAPVEPPVPIFVAKRRLVSLTVDYETWHPLPDGQTIDWDRDVFEAARQFAGAATRADARITFFVEMGEYFFLRRFEPALAARMEGQWRELVRAGHDVQLHLHPDWLPELGAHRDGGRWLWDARYRHANDYPGDLGELLVRCRAALEDAVRTEDRSYAVTCFRAGAYRAQPFGRLSAALRTAGIACDSSVFRGGVSTERGYDYTHAFSAHQPYLCSLDDPQLAAAGDDPSVLELPIATFGFGRRWSVDGADLPQLAARLEGHVADAVPSGDGPRGRSLTVWRALERVSTAAHIFSRGRVAQLPWLPPFTARSAIAHGHDYFVAIGHTKGDHDFEALAAQLGRIGGDASVSWTTASQMAAAAREDLERADDARQLLAGRTAPAPSLSTAVDDAEAIVAAADRHLPWAGREVRLIGNLAEAVAPRLAARFPWKRFTSLAAGATPEPTDLPCVLVAHAGPPSTLADPLERIVRQLSPGCPFVVPVLFDSGRLAYPGLPSARAVLAREWEFRLGTIGLSHAHAVVEERHPRLAAVVFAAAAAPQAARDHFARVMRWLYDHVAPSDAAPEWEPLRVLESRRALCLGYAATLGAILAREGYAVRYATLLARNHVLGRAPHGTDSHEVLEVVDAAGGAVVLDPTSDTLVAAPLLDVLRDPALAGAPGQVDNRYRERRYELYSTSYFYERVYEACVRSALDVPAYDDAGGLRAQVKLLKDGRRRAIFRRGADGWRRVRLPLDPRARVR